MLTPYLC